jgi:hypothetical protein
MRLLLQASVLPPPLSKKALIRGDIFTIYGKHFNLTDDNLNGDAPFIYPEYKNKLADSDHYINWLISNGLLKEVDLPDGCFFEITSLGKKVSSEIQSDYSRRYTESAKDVHEKISALSDDEQEKLLSGEGL